MRRGCHEPGAPRQPSAKMKRYNGAGAKRSQTDSSKVRRHLLVAAACFAFAGLPAARGRWDIAVILLAVGTFYAILFASILRFQRRFKAKAPLRPDGTDYLYSSASVRHY